MFCLLEPLSFCVCMLAFCNVRKKIETEAEEQAREQLQMVDLRLRDWQPK
jgi:ABC-type polar amino acid transport system ATPase subunit